MSPPSCIPLSQPYSLICPPGTRPMQPHCYLQPASKQHFNLKSFHVSSLNSPSPRNTGVTNLYRRRGASLRQRQSLRSLTREEVSRGGGELVEQTRSARQSPTRAAPSLRLLLARRQRWGGEPAPSSSETVIVKSLPYYPGAREALMRPAREPLPSPQVHSFRLERAREEEAVLRQQSQQADQPRFSSLLLEPVPAVPSPSLASPLLHAAVPAVPAAPTLSTEQPLSSTSPPRTRSPSFTRSSPTPFRARQRLTPVSAVPRQPTSPSTTRLRSQLSPATTQGRKRVQPESSISSLPALPQPLPQTQSQAQTQRLPQTQSQARQRPQALSSLSTAIPETSRSSSRTEEPDVTTRRPVVDVTELLPARPDPAKRVSHPKLG